MISQGGNKERANRPTIGGKLRGLVFGDRAGARYLAGRTLRALARSGVEAEDATGLAPDALAARLAAIDEPVWFVRAGAWPAGAGPIAAPPSSATGLPLVALGGVVEERPGTATNDECRAWEAWQQKTGGALNQAGAGEDVDTPPLPQPAGVYLELPGIASLAARLRAGLPPVDALAAELREPERRIIRLTTLDLHFDPHLRVAQVVTSLQRGGAERVTLDLHEMLPELAIRSRVVVLGSPTREAFVAPAGTIDVSRSADRLAAARRALEHFAADIVHGHLLSADAVRELAATGIPMLQTIHNMRPGWPVGLTELTPDDTALLVACSQAVERGLAEAGVKIATRTVWNGIDFAPLKPCASSTADGARLRREKGIGTDDFVLLALANPRPQKRLERLPAIVAATQAQLSRQGSPRKVWLLVAGEASRASPQAQEAERALDQAGAACGNAGRIVRLGAVNDLPTVLAATDALVSCSAYEGLSLAHLEALAAEVPVVATDVGGTAEIAHGNPAVRLVPPEASAESFAAALVSMATSAAPSGREPAARHFHRSRMAAGYRALYPRVIAASPRKTARSGIWLVANNFSTGGAQSSARRLLLGLREQGVRVRAAVLEEQPQYPTPGRAALMEAGISVFALPAAGTIDVAEAVPLLLDEIDADPPETVVFWNALPTYKLLLAHALLDTRVFDASPGEMYYTAWDKYFAAPRSGWPYRSPREYGRRLSGVIVKYQGEAELAARTLGAPVTVIPNGVIVPPANGYATRGERERLVIGTAARLSPQKKLEELFAALRTAGDRLSPYVLRIAGGSEKGSAEYADTLRRNADGLPIEWLGQIQDLRSFHHDLDLFAMISEPAGCPNASLEAMAAGLPVVATDFGGAAEQVIDGECGRIVPRGDAAALAEALVELGGDRELRVRYGLAARRRAEMEFDIGRMVSVYRRVLLGNGR